MNLLKLMTSTRTTTSGLTTFKNFRGGGGKTASGRENKKEIDKSLNFYSIKIYI